MKTDVYAVLYAVISNLAIALCFVPLLLLGWKKMRQVKVYRVIALYWLAKGLINLPNLDLFGQFRNGALQEKLNLYYNLLDTPLALLVFIFAASGRQRSQLLRFLLLFIFLELALIGWMGYNFESSTLIIGAGLVLILIYSVTGLVRYMQKMEHSPFENSMVFVYAALLFAYGSFLIIYIFIHIHSTNGSNNQDSFLLYYFSLLLSAAITSMGLWGYGLRRQAVA
ncbi:hypothetical protein ACX0G9_05625 [Flavitalea flava]